MDPDLDTAAGIAPLARAARRTLARPGGAQLLVDGLSPAGSTGSRAAREAGVGVELIDRDGTPVLLCDPDAPLLGAARRGRGATLTLWSDGPQRVVLRGRLHPAGRERTEDREVDLVELQLSTVVVRPDGRDGVAVPLADYHRDPGPVELGAHADAVLEHTNADHAEQLRDFAARLGGCDPGAEVGPHDAVAGARLVALDACGTVLQWVDLDGAHQVRLVFPRQARTPAELTDSLRHTLCPHG